MTIARVNSILNVSGYAFVELSDVQRLRERLHAQAAALGLKGTVLLAPEGTNVALAGPHAPLREWLAVLRGDARLAEIDLKFSESEALPFRRLVVKVRCEIIRMNQPVVRPEQQRAPSVDARTLASWLEAGHDDAGRAVVLLDARNGFEVDHGHFKGALDWRLARFSDFPQALQAWRAQLDGKTVVSYCTGGIRCEKAALWMRHEGIANVLQLDGGILRYFEVNGAAHFEGSCFVFDERTPLDGTLASLATV
jgi:UPF0176 protein